MAVGRFSLQPSSRIHHRKNATRIFSIAAGRIRGFVKRFPWRSGIPLKKIEKQGRRRTTRFGIFLYTPGPSFLACLAHANFHRVLLC
jgi:hypothetical protein